MDTRYTKLWIITQNFLFHWLYYNHGNTEQREKNFHKELQDWLTLFKQHFRLPVKSPRVLTLEVFPDGIATW